MFRARTGRPIRYLDDDALAVLMAYRWPGNVRELENAIEHAFVRCRGEVLLPGCLPPHLAEPSADTTAGRPAVPVTSGTGEREALRSALEASQWNRGEAARQLGMHRTTLWRKMKEYGL